MMDLHSLRFLEVPQKGLFYFFFYFFRLNFLPCFFVVDTFGLHFVYIYFFDPLYKKGVLGVQNVVFMHL